MRAASHPLLDGHPVGWFAPNYKFLTEAWRNLRRILKPVTASVSKTERRIELITGGTLDFWTLADEDAGRSYKYKRVIIDEAGLVRNLETSWNEAVRPTLTDLKGDAWLLGTPKGQNFFYKMFCWGQDPSKPEYSAHTAPTATNPTIDDIESEVEAARLGMPERSFEQEYLATFLEDGGGVFKGVAAVVDKGRTQATPWSNQSAYVLGADIARTNDFTVITVLEVETGRQVYFERINQIRWELIATRIIEVARQYLAFAVVDATGVGSPVVEQVQKALLPLRIPVYPFVFSNVTKTDAVDELSLAIEQQTVRLMDIPVQTNELQAYQYEVTPSRRVTMNAPAGMHDDTVTALVLANWGKKRRPRESTMEVY